MKVERYQSNSRVFSSHALESEQPQEDKPKKKSSGLLLGVDLRLRLLVATC